MNDVESPLFSVFMCVRWYTTPLYYFFSSPLSITVVVYSIIHSVVVVHFFFCSTNNCFFEQWPIQTHGGGGRISRNHIQFGYLNTTWKRLPPLVQGARSKFQRSSRV